MDPTPDRPDSSIDPVLTAAAPGIAVKCPKCGGMGLVTAGPETARFQCPACGDSRTGDRTVYRYDVQNQCTACGRFYRVDISDRDRQHFPVLRAACPHCGCVMPGKVQKTAAACRHAGEIENGREPFFGLELWFLTSFDGRPVWALNREHLARLIDYLRAGLREAPAGDRLAERLPTFMKTAKNRRGIVKALRRLQKT